VLLPNAVYGLSRSLANRSSENSQNKAFCAICLDPIIGSVCVKKTK